MSDELFDDLAPKGLPEELFPSGESNYKKPPIIYVIGALKNPEIPIVAERIRKETGYEVFDSWYSAGPDADDYLRDHLRYRGLTYDQAMEEHAVKHIFAFDKLHLNRADIVILLMPAAKSGHLEFGYAIGRGKRGYIVFDKEPERYEVMQRFAYENGGKVVIGVENLLKELQHA